MAKAQIAEQTLAYVKRGASRIYAARHPHWAIWRELAQYYLPYTHPWLLNKQRNETLQLNPNYITSEGLQALRVQSAGLMNGITSPARPWFKLGIGHDTSKLSIMSQQWLTSVTEIMRSILAKSNFYNTLAMQYFDLGLFGTTGTHIYEEPTKVIHLQRFQVGEYYLEYDQFGRLRRYDRMLALTLLDVKDQFGEENLPREWQQQLNNKDSWNAAKTIYHACWRKGTYPATGTPADRFDWIEIYWTDAADETNTDVLSVKGYKQQPAMFPRWSSELEQSGSPSMDALADMRELCQIILKKGIGLEKIIDPPMLIDATLRNERKSMIPGGYTYVPNLQDAVGARPTYQLQIPFQELRADIMELRQSIRQIHHNDLFKMISQLDTVRSAAEIDARREEKLVLLSGFLERYENEQLDPALSRTYAIALQDGLFPDPPQEILDLDIKPEYTSILSTVQRAIGTAPIERLIQVVGQVSAADQAVLDVVNFDQLVYTYALDTGVNPLILRDAEALRARRAAREEQLAAVEATANMQSAVKAARELSRTDVGGGANALQRLIA